MRLPKRLPSHYLKIRERSRAPSQDEFDKAVLDKIRSAKRKTSDWTTLIAFAKRVSFPCPRCAGTGRFITYVENGIPKGPGGICYRCSGKGRQNDADVRRNYGYDNHRTA